MNKPKINSKLISLLLSDPMSSMASLGFFMNFEVESFEIENQSAIVYGKSDHFWAHLIGNSKDSLSRLLQNCIKKTSYYYSVEDWMIPLILEHQEPDWVMTTNRYIFNPKQSIAPPKLNIQSMGKEWAPYIYEHSDYQSFISIEYIEERLSNDISAAIFYYDKPIAWALTHDDGALSFLHVLEKWRNKGLASEIVRAMLQKRKKQGQLVFCNVVKGNEQAEKLIYKLGFTFDRTVSWVKVKC